MHHDIISQSSQRAADVAERATNMLIERYLEPMTDFGNPEKVMGKRFEEWTAYDLKMLQTIYGQDSTLQNFISRKRYDLILRMEEGLP